ncbi:uncharacterized protein K460DRAFT_271426 [Cucurbitaria berberidis CBS 394.84]|uniref:Rhodopsin domain-containing protein n=1 Tax=Cucurbitaria berberidis CBS 394.84 TaxID=1168544 RepID=A0A9P4GVK1_9PLEO|nr:uncharacterized protein K460DRAFT_271426 [Cucurbitaria berberidis CBS 394.84]KAF1852102.1 hypothetical protein K460DRAFT_271426 [Cucurbitaria berberidis CBS 394.84]
MLLHCQPLKYNYTIPLENPRYCFTLRSFRITVASVGIALDGLIWILPHCVVWRLQLRLTSKLAITAIFALGLLSIVIGGLRINSFANVDLGDITFGIGATLIWSITQISTGIIVACCPYLRPVFEKMLSCRLTRPTTRRSQISHSRQSSITVTTSICLQDSLQAPPPQGTFHDGHQEPWAPTFDVERGPASEFQKAGTCCGDSPSCGCL